MQEPRSLDRRPDAAGLSAGGRDCVPGDLGEHSFGLRHEVSHEPIEAIAGQAGRGREAKSKKSTRCDRQLPGIALGRSKQLESAYDEQRENRVQNA
jgi:hypothetical protein